ncbi:HAD-IB family phosphatase [bacterium]|nr:HAD-IB family phosphatase [bacterium]
MRRAVFCDFDGTITASETFADVMRKFAPEKANELIPMIYEQSVTLRDGIKEIFRTIPVGAYDDIIEFTRGAKVRPGLDELLDYLNGIGVPFVVVSGGLRGMVEEIIAPYRAKVQAVFAPDVDLNDTHMHIRSDFESETELLSKTKVMDWLGIGERVLIGDSVTDLEAARVADLVFARDRLAEYLLGESVAFVPWETFLDVRDHLSQIHWATGR